jgi:L-arabinonolactonase
MASTATCVVDARALAGESPVWSMNEQCLWWVDIWGCRLHRYDPSSNTDRAIVMPDIVSLAAPHALGGLVVALRASVWHFEAVQSRFSLIAELPLPEASRLNDAVIDAQGRLWIGSMATPASSSPDGALWCIDVDGRIERVLDGLHSPNGLAFSPDASVLYLSDSHPSVRTVWAFDYDGVAATLRNRRTFVATHDLRGRPDGACVDARGRYWMAAVDGAAVLCLDASGQVVDAVDVPVEKPSKPAFGGPELDTLYVTSLRKNLSTPLEQQPLAGGLFAARVDVTGVRMPYCRVTLR